MYLCSVSRVVHSYDRLDRIQYRVAKLVTGTLHYTNKLKLYQELGWETIQSRANYLGITLFHKIHTNNTRPLIKRNMQPYKPNQNFRGKGSYQPFPYKNVKYKNSFFPYFTKQWNDLDSKTKGLNLEEFKKYQKVTAKPKKYKHFQRGPKFDCSLLTRIRVGNSNLNSHKFKTGFSNTTQCLCAHPDENSIHYITQCFLFTEERRTLYDQVSQFVPNFLKLSNKKQYDILIFGHEPDNVEMLKINTKFLLQTQKYIRSTKRFHKKQ